MGAPMMKVMTGCGVTSSDRLFLTLIKFNSAGPVGKDNLVAYNTYSNRQRSTGSTGGTMLD